MVPLVDQSDLEQCFSPKLVLQVFVDDGGRQVGPRLQGIIQAASDEAAAILGKVPAWRDPVSLKRFVQEDASARYAVCQLVMALGMNAKPEWYAKDGPSTGWRSEARKVLNDLAQREGRSPAEDIVGTNDVVYPRATINRGFEFARRRGREPTSGF